MGENRETVGWQYVTQYYRDKNGRIRKHRKKMYDLCECGGSKLISAKRCRQCYEINKSREDKAVELVKSCRRVLKRLVQAIESGEVEEELVNRAQKELDSVKEFINDGKRES